MKKIVKYQTLITIICLLFSMFIVGTHRVNETKPPIRFSFNLNQNSQNFSYFLNDKIPDIVEGTAKIFDTDLTA